MGRVAERAPQGDRLWQEGPSEAVAPGPRDGGRAFALGTGLQGTDTGEGPTWGFGGCVSMGGPCGRPASEGSLAGARARRRGRRGRLRWGGESAALLDSRLPVWPPPSPLDSVADLRVPSDFSGSLSAGRSAVASSASVPLLSAAVSRRREAPRGHQDRRAGRWLWLAGRRPVEVTSK